MKNLSGSFSKAVTTIHTANDNGKQFTDNYGRVYTYTVNGLIY